MNSLFVCTRMGREVQISPQTCLNNHRQAQERGERGFMLFSLEVCRFCEAGVKMGRRYPEGKLPKPPTCAISQTDRSVKHPAPPAITKTAATPTPEIPPSPPLEKGGEKRAKVGREGRDPGDKQSSFPDPGGASALKEGKIPPNPPLSKGGTEKPTPIFCAVCGAPGYGKSDRCFDHLLAGTARKPALRRAIQARYAAKVQGGAHRLKTCATRTELYPLNASPAVRRAYERQEAGT